MAGGLAEKRLQFLGCPGLWFHLGNRPHVRRVGDQGHVAVDHATLDSVLESTTDDEMNLQHYLRRQRSPVVGRVQHPVVERFQVVGSEPSDPEMANRREDVPVDLPSVSIPCRLGQDDLLAGQPGVGQVGAEGERPHLVVAPVQFGCQSGSQLLRFLPCGAGEKRRRSLPVTGSRPS